MRARSPLAAVLEAVATMPRYWLALLRGSAIGCWMGITPGGPTAASFMSYGLARRFSRRARNFGRGEPEGIVAPETADHAAGTSAMLPMLALGVPGSATSAVMLGGLMIWGLNPGPTLFADRPDFVWGLIASMYVANIVAVVLVLFTVPMFAAILRIPFSIIGPMIVVVCFIGAYSVAGSRPDLLLAVLFGIAGYAFKKLDYPIAPLVLAMVLGDKAEDAFRQSMIMSKGSLAIFWSNPLVATLAALGVLLLCWPLVGAGLRKLLPVRQPADAVEDRGT
jgi:TctA family transporter